MNNEELAKELGIPVIDADRKYWLVRTEQGSLWEEFKAYSYVAINWNELDDLSKLEKRDDIEKEQELKNYISELYEVDKPGMVLNAIRKFAFEMKIGDIIMIPSPKSKIISFGVIESDCFIHQLTEEDFENDSCEYIKRREVSWIKDINKNELDPLLFKMLQAHQAVCTANDYADVIDRTLDSIYVKNNIVHLKIDVNTPKPVGKNLVSLQSLIYDDRLIDNPDDVHIKVNIQSPGFIEVVYTHLPYAIGLAIALYVIVGGGKAWGIELPGIVDVYNKHKKQQHELDKSELEKLQEIYGEDLKSLDIDVIDNKLLNRILKVGKNIKKNKTDTE